MGYLELILAAINATLVLAPKVEEAAKAAKVWVAALFAAGVITKRMQDDVDAYVDARVELWKRGTPAHWTVEPNPGEPEIPALYAPRFYLATPETRAAFLRTLKECADGSCFQWPS